MERAGWHYPSGDFRVSDADRDRALSELRHALQVGRITADEFDQRAGDALAARTGTELTALLADLPVEHPTAQVAIPEPADTHLGTKIAIGASALGSAGFALSAVGAALNQGPSAQQIEFIQSQMRSQGFPAGPGGPPNFPPIQVFDWAAVITPGVIAVLLAVVVICLSVRLSRATRG